MRAPSSARLDAEIPDPETHLEFAARQYGDPRVARWHWPGDLGGRRTREQVREILVRERAQWDEVGFTLWWWRERAAGEVIGCAGLNRNDVEGEPVVEVGWSFNPERWGDGLATEAAKASLEWGFDTVGVDEIVAFTMPENHASRRVMEKLGMEYVRDFERKGFPQVLYRTAR